MCRFHKAAETKTASNVLAISTLKNDSRMGCCAFIYGKGESGVWAMIAAALKDTKDLLANRNASAKRKSKIVKEGEPVTGFERELCAQFAR